MLNWTQAPQAEVDSAANRSIFGIARGSGARRIDLDLGCLFELQNGLIGAVQAVGKLWGEFSYEPFMQLMGDDRTGAVSEGELLRINGARWDAVGRVLIYAFIYEGVPNWAAADGYVLVETPGQPKLEVRLDQARADMGMCAIAMLENVGGSIRLTKLAEYFRNHREMDERYGFGLEWVRGAKD